MSIVYGIPTHIFTTITVILAMSQFERNGIVGTPRAPSVSLIGPPSARRSFMIRSVTNCGTAAVTTNIVLQKALNLISFLLIMSARIIPKI